MVPTRLDACGTDQPEDSGEDALWLSFRNDGDKQARRSLLELYDSLARQVAAGLYGNRPDDTVEFADYLQYARVGLIEALDRYQPGGEASFKTFATYRIRGAVLNGVSRENDRREQGAWRARLQRERLHSLEQEDPERETEFGHLVDVAIGLALGYMLEDTGLIKDDTATAIHDNPYNASEYAEVCNRVAKALDGLPDREAAIIRYHYFDNIPFDAIAERLELSKGRVSQLHKRALAQIRTRLVASGIDQRI